MNPLSNFHIHLWYNSHSQRLDLNQLYHQLGPVEECSSRFVAARQLLQIQLKWNGRFWQIFKFSNKSRYPRLKTPKFGRLKIIFSNISIPVQKLNVLQINLEYEFKMFLILNSTFDPNSVWTTFNLELSKQTSSPNECTAKISWSPDEILHSVKLNIELTFS